MPRRYFKRHRMEYDLQRQEPPAAVLPSGFAWRRWEETTPADHAMVKFRAFQGGVDAEVFPSLGSYEGCLGLMELIAGRVDFVPAATWLLVSELSETLGPIAIGTIQVCTPTLGQAAVQNVGIVPEFRGCGLGRALVAKSLIGMRSEGLVRSTLDVTARNEAAVSLYQSLGFRIRRTNYRRVVIPRKPALAR